MTTKPLSVFLHLAAEAYRNTEVPEALEVANRIIAHAAVPVGQRPEPTIFSHLAGSLIVHRSNEPHAMLTNTAPLLAMWTWFGDLDWDSYELFE